jgi:hypothetical protein
MSISKITNSGVSNITLDSTNNRVGINQTTPAHPLHVGTDDLIVDASGNVGIGCSPATDLEVDSTITNGLARIGQLQFKNSSGNYATATDGIHIFPFSDGVMYHDNYDGGFAFRPNGTETARITANGITFNGDTAAVNALDDYEEGTWTPVVSTASSHSVQTGIYTKIGNLVNIQCVVQFVQSGTVLGSVSGLPFVVSSVNYTGITFREWYSTGITLSGNLTIGSQSTTGFWNYVNSGAAANGQTYGYGFSISYRTT